MNHTQRFATPGFQRASGRPRARSEPVIFYVWRRTTTQGYADAPVCFRHFEAATGTGTRCGPVPKPDVLRQPAPFSTTPITRCVEGCLIGVDFWLDMGAERFAVDAVPSCFEAEGQLAARALALNSRLPAAVEGPGWRQRADVLLLAEATSRSLSRRPTGQRLNCMPPSTSGLTATPVSARGQWPAAMPLRDCPHPCQEMVAGLPRALPLRNHDELWLGDVNWCPMRWWEAIPQWLSADARNHWLNGESNRRLAPCSMAMPGQHPATCPHLQPCPLLLL